MITAKDKVSALLVLLLVVGLGCTVLEPKPEESLEGDVKGLESIPYYHTGSAAFDTDEAQAKMEARVEEGKVAAATKKKQAEELKRRLAESGEFLDKDEAPIAEELIDESGRVGKIGDTDVPDPWIAPEQRTRASIPIALRGVPTDKYGYPDWVAAKDQGMITPVDSLDPDAPPSLTFDREIIFEINDVLMADVKYSHELHTDLFNCETCHPAIFIPARGTNDINMYKIWKGEFCGKCHGKVAFQAKGFENCQRCHSESKSGDQPKF
ncbi:MAG: cytochrome c3 family protein [Deltaproteobacteria bacterium]|nr:cytochrome c3 family protein [Deltaproteobacteria bacterium]